MLDTPSRHTFSKFPMLWLAIYFASGIVIGKYFEAGYWVAAILAAAIAMLCALRRSAVRTVIPLIFVPLGAICYQIGAQSVDENRLRRIYDEGRIESGSPVEIEGVMLGLPEPAYGGAFLLLRVEELRANNSRIAVSGKVRLFAPLDREASLGVSDQPDLRYGSRIVVMCRLEREERFRNPGGMSRIEMLDQQGIDATASIKSPLLIENLGDDAVFIPLAWVYEQRQRLIRAFRERFSERTAGVMIASLLGDRHFIDRPTAELFREGGTFHVLVISGLHITFIGGLTLWFVSLFTRRRSWQFLLSASFLWSYTLAVGVEVPVVRASIMFSFLLVGRALYRTGSLVNALGACTLVLLVWRPSDLFSASFQLTFVSVAAIVAGSFPLIEKLRAIGSWAPASETPLPPRAPARLRRFCELLYWNETAWKIENSRHIWSARLYKEPYLKRLAAPNLQSALAYLFEGLVVSSIVQICMLPLLIIYFHRVSPASLLLNLWVGGLLTLESFAAVGAVFVGIFSDFLAMPLIVATELLNSAMMALPASLSGSSIVSVRLPVYPGFDKSIYFIYAIVITALVVRIFKWDPFDRAASARQRWVTTSLGVATFAIALIIVFHPYSEPRPDGRLQIDFLDVGQGDSALVTFPDGQTMLVDGGGRVNYDDDAGAFEPDLPRIGESVVSEFLWERGYSQIDYMIATHSDADHIQGLVDVAENFDVGHVLVGRMSGDDPEFTRFAAVIERCDIPLRLVERGDDIEIGGSRVQVVHPSKVVSFAKGSENNSSVVVRISFGNREFLLTGDIEREAEADILLDADVEIRADVVKVAHHGSRTSSTEGFVVKTGAEVAVISVGRRSRFGHPHGEIVERWKALNAHLMTTGEKGTITISTDGRDLQIGTFIP